jgi:hypothetical protein
VRTTFVFLFSIAFAGCGARTGIGELVIARDASHSDAGVPLDAPAIDAWRPDTGADAPPPCLTDADCDDGIDCTRDACGREGCMYSTDDTRCDDGLFCDGVETCSLSGCVPSTTPCGDGVDCTHDLCDEARDACTYDPDDALCPISNICDPVRGCEPRLLAQDPTSIYSIALPSGDVTRIARTDLPLTDIALTGDGTYYGATTARGLVRVDPHTGATTPVVRIGGRFYGLEADPSSDVLYGGSDDRIVRFDLVSGSLTDVARLPAGEIVSGDFAFVGGRLLVTATTNFRTAPDDLFAIDLASSGPPTLIGNTGHPCIFGLAVYRDTLYGLTCDGLVLQIDATTAAATVMSRTTIEFDGGAAR